MPEAADGGEAIALYHHHEISENIARYRRAQAACRRTAFSTLP